MLPDPMEKPALHSSILRTFADFFKIETVPKAPRPSPPAPLPQGARGDLCNRLLQPSSANLDQLIQMASAFAQLPYENLSKIIRQAETGSIVEARRLPGEVITDHIHLGTGGTCFSLTATLLHLVRALGWQAEPLLADRRYGANTHCALLVWIEGQPHLLDPGFLLVRPVPLPRTEPTRIATGFNEVILTPKADGARVDLETVQYGHTMYRLTYKTEPADRAAFLGAWDASFDWDMMHYPVVTRQSGDKQIYLQKNRLLVRDIHTAQRTELDPGTLVDQIAQTFGIASEVAARALTILRRKGDSYGSTAIS